MANKSCLTRDQREHLFDKFCATIDGSTREQIIQQLFSITPQEASQMEFMLHISRSISKAYADLVAKFNSSLTNLVLIRRDVYLCHTPPNLDTFRLRHLCSAPISGGDLFDRSPMQEYEQHLIALGAKTGTKKECFHPYNKRRAEVEIKVTTLPKVCSTNPCQHLNTWCNIHFTPTHKGVVEEVMVAAEVVAAEATHLALSSSNLLSDTQTNVLASSHPCQKEITFSETLLDYFYPHDPPEGEKTLSATSFQERPTSSWQA